MADHAVVADDEAVDLSRRKFLTRATIATGAVGAVFAAVPFVESWQPSERARAQGAPAELDLSKLEPGQMAITIWRKQPIYVVRRTPDMVQRISGHDGDLKDPQSKDSTQPPYANNTHALAHAGVPGADRYLHAPRLPAQAALRAGELYPSWPGGFFCPCHGSRFDLAGRVFDGSPASINLRVPPYSIRSPRRSWSARMRKEPPDGP